MKRFLLSLPLMTMSVYAMAPDNFQEMIDTIKNSKDANQIRDLISSIHDPKEIRLFVEAYAKDFGKRRANPISYRGHWQAAFTAYAFKELREGKPVLDILHIVSQRTSIFGFNDEVVTPYFDQACGDWEGLKKSAERDWQAFCSSKG